MKFDSNSNSSEDTRSNTRIILDRMMFGLVMGILGGAYVARIIFG